MPTFRFPAASVGIESELKARLMAAGSLLESLARIAQIDRADPFSSRTVELEVIAKHDHAQGPGLPILIAAGGIHLQWSGDQPTFEIGEVTGAIRVIRAISDGLRYAEGNLVVAVTPDLTEITRTIIVAATDGRAILADAATSTGTSHLPGLGDLDDQQLAAVVAPLGSDLLINAAAGSGKTHTLAFRLALEFFLASHPYQMW